MKKEIKKSELELFRSVNGANTVLQDGHINYIASNTDKDVTKNQGISRGKLRNFIENGGELDESWKNL